MPASRREGLASGQDQHTVIVVTVAHIGLVLLLFRVNSPVLKLVVICNPPAEL